MRHIVFFIGIVFAICSCTKLEDPILGLTNRVEISTSTPVTAIGPDTAFAGGIIKTDGGESIIERGVVWSTSANPTISGKDRRKAGAGLGNFLVQIDTLIPFRDYFVRAYATNYYGTVYGQQVTFKTIKGRPRLGNSFSMSRDAYNIKLAGTLVNDGGDPIDSRGFCLSVNPSPTILLPNNSQNRVVTATTSASYFEATAGDLLPQTNYFIRSYARNTNGTSYGKQFQVKTEMGAPKIDPIVVSNIQATTVRLSMKITSAEGGRIVRYGFAISSTIRSPLFSQEGSEVRLYENSLTRNMLSILFRDPSSGSGTFEVDVKDLKAGTTYYVTGYAINENEEKINKTTHTAGQQFTTKGPPSVENFNSSNPSYTSFVAFARVLGDGGSNVFERGFYVGTNPTPWINGEKRSSGSGVGDFQLRIDGRIPNFTYYYVAYAINEFGETIDRRVVTVKTLANTRPKIFTAPRSLIFNGKVLSISGTVDDDGGLGITERGFLFSRINQEPVESDSRVFERGGPFSPGSYSNTISPTNGLVMGNVLYFVRSYATNGLGTSLGPTTNFRTPTIVRPTVRTLAATNVLARSARLNGIIDLDGNGTISSTGFFLATNSAMTNPTEHVGNINTNFFRDVPVSPNTTYWYQAFAKSENNTLTSQITLPAQEFKTLCAPGISSINAGGLTSTNLSTTRANVTVRYSLTDLGGANSVNVGICLSLSSLNPSPVVGGVGVTSPPTISASGLLSFSTTFNNLTRGAQYAVQTYVDNCFGRQYNGVSFFTVP